MSCGIGGSMGEDSTPKAPMPKDDIDKQIDSMHAALEDRVKLVNKLRSEIHSLKSYGKVLEEGCDKIDSGLAGNDQSCELFVKATYAGVLYLDAKLYDFRIGPMLVDLFQNAVKDHVLRKQHELERLILSPLVIDGKQVELYLKSRASE